MTSISGVSMSTALLQQIRTQPPSFQDIDSDSSGGISLDEFTAAAPTDSEGNVIKPPAGAASIEETFSSLDADGNGSLSESELASSQPPEMPAGDISGGLLSGDTLLSLLGSMSDEELTSLYEVADANGDGSLTAEELEEAFDSLEESVLSASGSEAQAAPPAGGGGAPPSQGAVEDEESSSTYDVLDTNEDGTVSLEELLAANDGEDETSSSDYALQSFGFNQAMLSLQEQLAA